MSALIDLLTNAGKMIDQNSVEPLSVMFNFPEDQVRLILVWFSMFPVGWFLHFCVRGTKLRHAVNLTIGTMGMTYFFGSEIGHVLFMATVSYLIMTFTPRDA